MLYVDFAALQREKQPISNHIPSNRIYLILKTVFTMVLLVVLLLLFRLLHCGKLGVAMT